MNSLPVFLKLKGRPVILLGEGEPADAKRRLLERAGAEIVGEDAQAALAIVAIEDDGQAEAAVDRLKTRGLLVNAVDRPELCDFTTPAIVDRDPVLLAIGTGGASAGLAKALRQRLERMLSSALGSVAARLKERRSAIKAKWPDGDDRCRAIDAALDEGGQLDPFAQVEAEAVDRWLAAAGDVESEARLETIQLRSCDPDELTIREALLLGRADRLYLAPGVSAAIANRARADAERIEADAPPADPGPGLSIFITPPE